MFRTSVIASMTVKQTAAAKVSVEARPCSEAAAAKDVMTVADMRNGSIDAKRRYMAFSALTCASWGSRHSAGWTIRRDVSSLPARSPASTSEA